MEDFEYLYFYIYIINNIIYKFNYIYGKCINVKINK